MKNILILISFSLLMSSCGIFKSTNKQKRIHTETTKTVVEQKRDTVTVFRDRSVIKESSIIDTVIKVPGKSISSESKPNKSLLQEGMVTLDSAGVKVKLTLDSATGMLRTLVNIDTTEHIIKRRSERIEERDVSQQSRGSQSSKEEKQTAVEDKNKTVQRTPIKTGVLAAIILGAVLIVSFFVWLYFRVKKTKI